MSNCQLTCKDVQILTESKPMRQMLAVNISGLVLLLASLGTGCITSREGQMPPITQWPPEAKAVKPSISLMVSGKVILNGQEQDVSRTVLVHQWRALTIRAYQDSGLFSNVKEGTTEGDLSAEINVVDQGDGNSVMPLITGLTMGLIPSAASDAVTLRTILKDSIGTTIGTFQMQETTTLWMQLFLVFAMPFRTAENALVYDLNRATIQEARGKGQL
jgi:hypothetical protein